MVNNMSLINKNTQSFSILDREPFVFSLDGMEDVLHKYMPDGSMKQKLQFIQSGIDEEIRMEAEVIPDDTCICISNNHLINVKKNTKEKVLLSSSGDVGICKIIVHKNVSASLEMVNNYSGFLFIELKENSRLEFSIHNNSKARFLMIQSVLLDGASLSIHDSFVGSYSWGGFHANMNEKSMVKHIQRTVANKPGKHFFSAQFIVPPNVIGADIEQNVKVIKTDKNAKIELRPWLWIGNRHVAAKHGAAIGDVDKAARLYLESRGLHSYEAKQTLINAFLRS